jgi:hypothetical protein
MQQAQTTMNNPMAQGVPQPSPLSGIANHPIIQQIGQALAKAMQNIGFAGATPQVRQQGQEMEQRKAEAMANISATQQGLQQGQQRIGIESGRAEQEKAYQTGELGLGAERNKTEALRTQQQGAYQTGSLAIEKQRADQEYQQKKQELAMLAEKTAAEYGPGGLRSKEVGVEQQNAASNASRAGTDAKLASIADAREQLEAQYKQAEAQRAGLSTDRATLEDERKSRIAAANEIYGKSPWYETRSTSMQRMQDKIKEINDDINGRISQAEKAAGTGMGAATSALPTNKVQAKQQQNAPAAGIKVIRDANGRISGIQ